MCASQARARTAGLSVEIFETICQTVSQSSADTLSPTHTAFSFSFNPLHIYYSDFLLLRSNSYTRASFVEGLISVGGSWQRAG